MTTRAKRIAGLNAILGVAVAGVGIYLYNGSVILLALAVVGGTIVVVGGVNSMRDDPGYYSSVTVMALGMATILAATYLSNNTWLAPLVYGLGIVISILAVYNGHTAACHRAVSLAIGE